MGVWEQSAKLRARRRLTSGHLIKPRLHPKMERWPTYIHHLHITGGLWKRGAFWMPDNHPFWGRIHILVAR